jgi:hypothetical protein
VAESRRNEIELAVELHAPAKEVMSDEAKEDNRASGRGDRRCGVGDCCGGGLDR